MGGAQHISVVNGELQDSAAHALRGVGPAVDLPATLYTPLQCLEPTLEASHAVWSYDTQNGYNALWMWTGTRGEWSCRYSHLVGAHDLRADHTGAADGDHLHLVLWLDGGRIKPEEQPEFVALL